MSVTNNRTEGGEAAGAVKHALAQCSYAFVYDTWPENLIIKELIMLDLYSLKPEARYGCPAADQVLINRFYIVGYSYYFRQAKWALEIVDPDKKDLEEVERLDNFRPDFRIPKRFRADLSDYAGSGFDRGHLVASADLNDENIQNSETFLLSNMSPQAPRLNQRIWRQLETSVRRLDKKSMC